MIRCLTLGLLLVCLTCILAQFPIRRKPQEKKVPDATCLNCICQASSNCDEKLKCHNAGAYYCGPFLISWAYWHDAGRPGDKGGSHDFETCLNNRTCAEKAVTGYMRKHGQDCDGNGVIDCYDFARIHKLGYGACGGDAIHNTEYWEKLEICYAGYDASDNNNDGNYGGANDGSYGGANDGSYGGENDGSYGRADDGSLDGANDGGANYNGGNLGGFVDYGDDHIQARDARMGG